MKPLSSVEHRASYPVPMGMPHEIGETPMALSAEQDSSGTIQHLSERIIRFGETAAMILAALKTWVVDSLPRSRPGPAGSIVEEQSSVLGKQSGR